MKAHIAAEAADMVRINNEARARFGLPPLGVETPESRTDARTEARREGEERPVQYRAARVAKVSRSMVMASVVEMARVRELLAVDMYGWQIAVERLSGVSQSALKAARAGASLRDDIARKICVLSMEEIRREVGEGRRVKSASAISNGLGGQMTTYDYADEMEVLAVQRLVWPVPMPHLWVSALKHRCRVSGGVWVKLKAGNPIKVVMLERIKAVALDPETEALRVQMTLGVVTGLTVAAMKETVDAPMEALAAKAGYSVDELKMALAALREGAR
jgi:hypothetical protein